MTYFTYRGFMPRPGKWIYGDFVDGTYIKNKHGMFGVDPSTVGPAISLIDKNFKEIYDGDILMHSSTGNVGLVRWQDCGWVFAEDEHFVTFCDEDAFQYEVIGNIYQHPRKLEGDLT